MSFSRKYLPEVDDLKELYKKSISDSIFLNEILGKSDVVIGSDESHEFILSIIEKVKSEKSLE